MGERNRNGKRERERQGWEREIEREPIAGERERNIGRETWVGERDTGEKERERERERGERKKIANTEKFMEFYLVVLQSGYQWR